MTKSEARDLYLRYLGEATVNGMSKGDRDLLDQFDHLLPVSLLHLATVFPLRRVVVCDGAFLIPSDFLSLESLTQNGRQIPYRRNGDEGYLFSGEAQVIYRRLPLSLSADDDDGTELDCAPGCGALVALHSAMMAAGANPDHAYQISYLSTLFNTMAASLRAGDAPRSGRVYEIGGI